MARTSKKVAKAAAKVLRGDGSKKDKLSAAGAALRERRKGR
jgi:hypothetical protein